MRKGLCGKACAVKKLCSKNVRQKSCAAKKLCRKNSVQQKNVQPKKPAVGGEERDGAMDEFRIHESVFRAEGSRIVRKVALGRQSSVWYNAVLRGDEGGIRIDQPGVLNEPGGVVRFYRIRLSSGQHGTQYGYRGDSRERRENNDEIMLLPGQFVCDFHSGVLPSACLPDRLSAYVIMYYITA